MGAQEPEFAEEKRVRRAFKATFFDLARHRRSLINLCHIVRKDRQRIKQLEKIVSSFVKPN